MQKRISELTPEEQQARRAYNRESKRRSREREKQTQILSHDEAFDTFPEEHTKALSEHAKGVLAKVKSELGVDRFGDYQDNEAAESAICQVAWTLFAFKKDWVQQVHSPDGEFVGGVCYADSLGADIVAAAHRYGLLNSPTFLGLFRRELLPILDERYGHEQTVHARAIKAELSDEFRFSCW